MARPKKGTKKGNIAAAKWRATMEEKHGGPEGLHKRMQELGTSGGCASKSGGFASDKIGADGLTGRQRAHIAGRKGGLISKRGKSKPKEVAEAPLIKQKRKGWLFWR